MKNFIFKSTSADLQKMFQSIETIQKNVLYLTYNVDKVLKIVASLHTNMEVERQTTDYYQSKIDEETSPQTDSDNK